MGTATLSTLKNGTSTVNASNYTYVAGVLTIDDTYLATLVNGDKTFTIVMTDGGDMTAVVTVAD